MVKLVEGLKGQTWASDWLEELRQADWQKEQAFRWGLGGGDMGRGFSAGSAACPADVQCSVSGRRR